MCVDEINELMNLKIINKYNTLEVVFENTEYFDWQASIVFPLNNQHSFLLGGGWRRLYQKDKTPICNTFNELTALRNLKLIDIWRIG